MFDFKANDTALEEGSETGDYQRNYESYLKQKRISNYFFIGYALTVVSSFLNAGFYVKDTKIAIKNENNNTKIEVNKEF